MKSALFLSRAAVVAACVSSVLALSAVRAANWDGDGASGNFDWWNNWYGDSLPAQTFNSSTPLYFNYNNSGQATLNQNIGYKSVQAIIFESTFSGNVTVNGSDGFDLYWKVENNDTGSHTINTPLVVQGSVLELNPINGNLTVGGGINNFNNRNLDIYGDNGNTLTLNTTFSGSGANLTLKQNSIVVVNNSQTYTGDPIIDEGIIRLGGNNLISDSSDLVINNTGKFDNNGFNDTVNSLTLNSGGTLELDAGQLIVNNAAGTWAGEITGSAGGSVVKKGSGTVSVTGNNGSMAGDWYVVNGTVGFNHNNAAGSGIIYLGETSGSDAAKIDISVNGVNIANDIVVRSGSSGIKTIDQAVGSGTVTFSGDITLNDNVVASAGSGETLVLSGDVSGTGKIIQQGAGQITLSGNNSYSGNTEIDAGTFALSGDLSGSSTIYIGNGGNSSDATLQLSGSGATLGSLQVNASAGSGARTLNVTAGSHTFSGGSTTVNRDFTINATGGSLNMSQTVSLNQSEGVGNELTLNANGGTITLSGSTAVNLGSDKDVAVSGSSATVIAGTISASSGAAQINKSGSGTLTINGNNSSSYYMLNIAAGTVVLNSANAFGAQNVSYNDKVNFTGSSTLEVTGNTTLNNNIGFRVSSGQTATFEVGAGATFSVAGVIANNGGAGNVVKDGTGAMVYSGTSTFTGSTDVNAGTLQVDASGDMTSSSGFTVNGGTLDIEGDVSDVTQEGGTVSGGGTINGDYVQNSGVMTPGNSPGTLNVVGNATWAGGSYLWEINDALGTQGVDPGWDLESITGTLTINGPYTINVDSLTIANAQGNADNFNAATDYSWVIATAAGGVNMLVTPTLSIAGFSNPHNGAGAWSITADANNVYVNYDGDFIGGGGGGGAVPEPGSFVMLALASVFVLGLRKRRLQVAARGF